LSQPDVSEDLPRELGDGLVLRRASIADREALATLHANNLLEVGEEPPLAQVYDWVLDLMSEEHPSSDPRDFTIVEETATGKIVSSAGLLSQTWTYEGIPFAVGQPEVISTEAAYRRRGLVRVQMAQLHRWSEERGDLAQGIVGIPWYYRQFGYEMALHLGASRVTSRGHVPRLPVGEPEPYTFRTATPDDFPFFMALYRQTTSRSAIAAVRDEALWRFDLECRHPQSSMRRALCVIEPREAGSEPVGVLMHSRKLWDPHLWVRMLEVRPGVPWLAVVPSVLRYLDATATAYAARDGGTYDALAFDLGQTHPLYDTVPERVVRGGRPYAWYIRVPDLLRFLCRIAPALERRLALSQQAGYSGAFTVSFFRDGLRLSFQEGRMAIERWQPEQIEAGDALFPGLTFLQVLFGFRSLADLEYAFPDCAVATDNARALLPILFPQRNSVVWSGG
jgi:hypothetical protein